MNVLIMSSKFGATSVEKAEKCDFKVDKVSFFRFYDWEGAGQGRSWESEGHQRGACCTGYQALQTFIEDLFRMTAMSAPLPELTSVRIGLASGCWSRLKHLKDIFFWACFLPSRSQPPICGGEGWEPSSPSVPIQTKSFTHVPFFSCHLSKAERNYDVGCGASFAGVETFAGGGCSPIHCLDRSQEPLLPAYGSSA